MPTLPLVKDPSQLSGLTLAYIGDAVYELYVRHQLLKDSVNAHRLNDMARRLVNHHAQAELYDRIEGFLSEADAAILRRGRNAKGQVPKKGDPEAYRKATAIEALVGYYYLSEREYDLHELLAQIDKHSEKGVSHESS